MNVKQVQMQPNFHFFHTKNENPIWLIISYIISLSRCSFEVSAWQRILHTIILFCVIRYSNAIGTQWIHRKDIDMVFGLNI